MTGDVSETVSVSNQAEVTQRSLSTFFPRNYQAVSLAHRFLPIAPGLPSFGLGDWVKAAGIASGTSSAAPLASARFGGECVTEELVWQSLRNMP